MNSPNVCVVRRSRDEVETDELWQMKIFRKQSSSPLKAPNSLQISTSSRTFRIKWTSSEGSVSSGHNNFLFCWTLKCGLSRGLSLKTLDPTVFSVCVINQKKCRENVLKGCGNSNSRQFSADCFSKWSLLRWTLSGLFFHFILRIVCSS